MKITAEIVTEVWRRMKERHNRIVDVRNEVHSYRYSHAENFTIQDYNYRANGFEIGCDGDKVFGAEITDEILAMSEKSFDKYLIDLKAKEKEILDTRNRECEKILNEAEYKKYLTLKAKFEK